jgi:hypothetical protein
MTNCFFIAILLQTYPGSDAGGYSGILSHVAGRLHCCGPGHRLHTTPVQQPCDAAAIGGRFVAEYTGRNPLFKKAYYKLEKMAIARKPCPKIRARTGTIPVVPVVVYRQIIVVEFSV